MSILDKIVEKKKERLSSAKLRTTRSALISIIGNIDSPRNFQQAVAKNSGDIKLIAEIKKASPARGLIRTDFDHVRIASIYEEKNVDAISVITEEDFFQGKIDFLSEAKKNVTMPVLRKEFIFDEYQIYEARANSADAVLLIAAILGKNQAEEYINLAGELGMSVLFEVHNMKELGMALKLNAPVIGINNRDLTTLKIDLATSLNLKKEIPAGKVVVSESGISSREDVLRIESAGIDAMLVGTCLMNSGDIGAKIDYLRGNK